MTLQKQQVEVHVDCLLNAFSLGIVVGASTKRV